MNDNHPDDTGCGVCGAVTGDGLWLCIIHTDALERDLRRVDAQAVGRWPLARRQEIRSLIA